MSEWVRIDAEKLNTSQPQAIRGVDITVRMSPYDKPEAVRGGYDEDLRRFVIEFRYMGDEPLKHKQEGKYIRLRIGRNSGRLYGIEVDVDAMKAQAVDLNVEVEVSDAVLQAINSLPQKHPRHENYEVAKDTITQKKGEIFASLAAG